MRPSITNRVANSTLTLPGALVLGSSLWALVWRPELLGVILATAFTAYVLMETNNRNTLIRVRTRSMSSLFWLGAPLVYIALASHGGESLVRVVAEALAMEGVEDLAPVSGREMSLLAYGATPCLLALATFALFSTYGETEPVTSVFHCFVALGAAVCFCPPLVVCVPAFLLYLIIYMNVWSARVFSAALLGLMLVAMCATLLVVTRTVPAEAFFPHLQMPTLETFRVYPASIVVMLMGFVGMCYFLGHNYDDKIQVRMMHYVLVCQWMLAQLLLVLQPGWLQALAPVSWFCTAPLVAYQLSLSDSLWTSFWAVLILAVIVGFMVWTFAI